MGIFTIILIALGLSVDSFAVSVTCGLVKKRIIFWDATKIAFSLAFFQAGFTFMGWIFGNTIKDYISRYDHWIAFILLGIIGLKMIYESLKQKEEDDNINPLKPSFILTMSIATSIDALVVGISFAFFDSKIILTTLIIGAITFIASMLGILFGKKTGDKFGKRMEIIGGLVLFGIGLKILIEHLYLQG